VNFKAEILNKLLDKYEESRHFQGKAVVNRKVKISFAEKDFPQYWEVDKPYLKKAVHQVVFELAEQGLIEIEWVPFEKGNIIRYVSLNLEQVPRAYLLADRVPKKDELSELMGEIENLQKKIKIDWINRFLEDCLLEIQEKQRIPARLPKDKEERELLFKTFIGLQDLNESEILERVFSLKYLGNSKLFQKKIRRKLASLAGQYLHEGNDLSEDDILAELGINKTSDEVLIRGPIIFSYQGRIIDYTPFFFGGIIDTRFVGAMKIIKADFKKLLVIENKANFHFLTAQNLPQDILLLYIGGFPGPLKRKLLEKIYQFNLSNKLKMQFYHWGDLDVGGLKIFNLVKGVLPTLEPLFMDSNTLLRYKGYGDVFDPGYEKQVEKLLSKKEFAQFKGLLEVMLQEKIRLEQEALLTDKDLLFENEIIN